MSDKNIYSSNNHILTGSSIPTEGTFKVGDIIVNNGANAAEEPMWICIEAGTPGVWKAVGAGEDLSGLQTQNKDSLVAAINELFQSANNGKELIASAIGEPLSAEDTFSAMSNDINGLLSTFKTNMMNNGVTVESTDKFKALIDKIATMVEEGSSKGIKFATGSYTPTGATQYATIPWNLDFTPTFIFAHCTSTKFNYSNMCYANGLVSNINNLDSYFYTGSNQGQVTFSVHAFDTSTLTIRCQSTSHTGGTAYIDSSTPITWYVIGVGEEDTTLRDSLADILENKGVDVTEEDDMASLITKVGGVKSGGLDIIAATELPVTGKENQVCVITDNPEGSFLITTSSQDVNNEGFLVFNNSSSSIPPITITNNGIAEQYRISTIKKGTQYLPSYVYSNGVWNNLTNASFVLFDGTFKNTDFSGGFNTGSSHVIENSYLRMNVPSVASFKNQIDFTHFNTIIIKTASTGNSSRAPIVVFSGPHNVSSNGGTSGAKYSYTIEGDHTTGAALTTTTIDISSWQGLGYLNIAVLSWQYVANMKFTYLEIR